MKLTNKGMGRVYKLYTLLLYVIPMITLFIIKRDEYSSQGSIFGFWGILVLILCVIMFKNFCVEVFKKFRILTVSLVILILGIFAEFLAAQLIVIGAVSVSASIISLLVSVVGDVYDEHAYKVIDGQKIANPEPAIPQKQAWKEAYLFNMVADGENK